MGKNDPEEDDDEVKEEIDDDYQEEKDIEDEQDEQEEEEDPGDRPLGETSADNVDQVDWEGCWSLVASSRPDMWPSSRRQDLMDRAQSPLQAQSTARHRFRTWLAEATALTSPHAHRRMAWLMVETLWGSALEFIIQNNHPNQENHPQNGHVVASSSNDADLLDWAQLLAQHVWQGAVRLGNPEHSVHFRRRHRREGGQNNHDGLVVEFAHHIRALQKRSASDPAFDQARSTLVGIFYRIATTASLVSSWPSPDVVVAAVALGAALEYGGPSPRSPERKEWYQILLTHTLTYWTPADHLSALAGPALLTPHVTSLEAARDVLGPALVTKLKSHPDKALSPAHGWVRSCTALHQHAAVLLLTDAAGEASPWTAVLLKQITSAKDINRQVTSNLVVDWSRASSAARWHWALALSTATVPLAPARLSIYITLLALARDAAVDDDTDPPPNDLLNSILNGLDALFKKEVVTTKTESSSLTRSAGQEAMVAWMLVARRYQPTVSPAAPDSTGSGDPYAAILTHCLVKPIFLAKNIAEGGSWLTLLLRHGDDDPPRDTSAGPATTVVGQILADWWSLAQTDKKAWEKALEGCMETASTKKSTQVDALVLVYCALLPSWQASSVPSLSPSIAKVVSTGSLSCKTGPAFMYNENILEAMVGQPWIGTLLARIMSMYVQLAALAAKESAKSKSITFSNLFAPVKVSPAARALACCVLHARPAKDALRSDRTRSPQVIEACLKTIMSLQAESAPGLVQALLEEVNRAALSYETDLKSLNATRDDREDERIYLEQTKGRGSIHASHRGYDAHAVRRAARLLSRFSRHDPKLWARVMVLMHDGSALRNHGQQRSTLTADTLKFMEEIIIPSFPAQNQESSDSNQKSTRTALSEEIILLASQDAWPLSTDPTSANLPDSIAISSSLHKSALSLLVSLGLIARNFSPSSDDTEDDGLVSYVFASKLCIEDIAERLVGRLNDTLRAIEDISADDIEVFMTPIGSLHQARKGLASDGKSAAKRRSDEEEWDLQMKKELEERKKKEMAGASTLSAEQQAVIAEQDATRRKIASLLHRNYARILESISALCSSDIEVGNECLPKLSETILVAATSTCPAFDRVKGLRSQAIDTLGVLAQCVYEIDEMYAATMSEAILMSCRKTIPSESSPRTSTEKGDLIAITALPSPCPSAAKIMHELDEFGDCVSGSSFFFLFPIIHACLMGPRTPAGCESSLRNLHRHTALLAGDGYHPVVARIRKDMIISVLELLKHDRAQTFHEPTAFEALVDCYLTDATENGRVLTTAELAPLLDDRGALGNKNCRLGAMMALARIATDHVRIIRTNPLVENRIWLNCFESDEGIRLQAQRAWLITHDEDGSFADSISKPSPLYAAPLVPLLSNKDISIASAAAKAYAHGMALHPSSVSRSIELLCKTYIDAFPLGEGGDKSSDSAKSVGLSEVAAKKKSNLLSGLPKKKPAAKQSPLDIVSGIGKPKAAPKKKSAVHSALLKPKEERTLNKEELESQFKTAGGSKKEDDKETPEKIAVRLGVLRAISAVTQSDMLIEMDESTLKLLTSFLMAYGIAEKNDDLRTAARNALRDIVASKGGSEEAISFLLPHLESVLKTGVADETCLGSLPTEKVPKDVSASDSRKEGAVVALGSVALHLKGAENEAKIDGTIDMLISTLSTPSEDVQLSVADALEKLMKKGKTQERVEGILANLVQNCLYGTSLAGRRGAAYGIAAVIKGSGIATLKKFEIVKKLEEACSDGGPSSKEGALFAVELLSARLGLLFEPYVIVLLPSLLKSFSDSSDHVRQAAANTASLIMSKLSAHGVKLVMPAVLTAFNDPAWRTKQASIHMLGSMSHLAPKQLASALPKVVPKLTEAFSDTHPKVKASAQEALHEISTVIKNPEISTISNILLKALTDPADYTTKALETMIETEFLHAIDAPSLALIVPILHRGLRDRGASTKRFGSLIAGNMCTMINDPKDMVPYLSTLLPDLQLALLDPIPDVRSSSAKALGSLSRSLGDEILPEIQPWLIKKLQDRTCSSAERSGAAQGLTEVLIASGSEFVLDTMRDQILPLHSHPEASTREGVIWVLAFLPTALGQGFTPLIDISLPALIGGLSDDSELVRDVSMRAGRVLIRSHGKVQFDKILPSLEAGLENDDHRIRVSSLSLLGDLLGTIGGTTVVKGEGDTQDDIRRAERAQAQIALVLGTETRRRVLSGLYLARSDTVHMVRQSAIQVWKTVVSVTARTLRDILPALVAKIIDNLASGHEEKTLVAGQCLGDVVSKLGDTVLPQIIPVLRKALSEGGEHTKLGVCVGLTEVIKCSTKEQIIRFIEIIGKLVQDALSDEDARVRKLAASSFLSFHSVVGSRALDEIVPSLMVALENNKSDAKSRKRAMLGLTSILTVRSKELLPYIIPKLIERPFSADHARALASVAEVTGATIHHHFATIIPALLFELADTDDGDPRREAIRSVSSSLCRHVDEGGIGALVSEITAKTSNDKATIRRESCRMFADIVTERAAKEDFYELIPVMLRELLYRLNDDDVSVLKATNEALSALSTHVSADELVKHVEFMRNLIGSMVSDARRRKGGVGDGEFLMPGFNMPKGLDPLMPIYQRGILYGAPATREVSAAGLGEVISLTSSKFLAGPMVVKMTGPLLRVVGDRNPSNVKVAILKTLGLVLVKGGPALRAFVPQFQTTFVKALSDPSRQVRVEAIAALSLLMPLSTRVDPLIKELVTGSMGKNIAVEGLAVTAVQTATLEALASVLESGGDKAKLPTSVPSALEAAKELISSSDEGVREAAATVVGASCALLGSEVTREVLGQDIIPSLSSPEGNSTDSLHGKLCAVRWILEKAVNLDLSQVLQDLQVAISALLGEGNSGPIREAGCVAIGAVVGGAKNRKAALRSAEKHLLPIMRNTREAMEVHQAVGRGLCVALAMIEPEERIDFMGLQMLDACLQLAMSGAQRVQFGFHDVLWLALNVAAGSAGLDKYAGMAMFDNVRTMRSLFVKVLTRIKAVTTLDK